MHDKIVSRSRFRLDNTLATRQHTGLTIVSETRMSPLPNSLRVPLSVYHCPWITPLSVDYRIFWFPHSCRWVRLLGWVHSTGGGLPPWLRQSARPARPRSRTNRTPPSCLQRTIMYMGRESRSFVKTLLMKESVLDHRAFSYYSMQCNRWNKY